MRLLIRICLPAALFIAAGVTNHAQAVQPCGVCPAPLQVPVPHMVMEPKPAGPNWIFQPGNYSHDPRTGERIAQFAPLPAVEALPDTRGISSGYQLTRVNQFGTGGSADTYYRVENWSNVAGGLDAQWERVNDVWQQSVITGSYGSGSYENGYGPYGGRPYPGYGYGGYGPGYGYGPGNGFGPGYGGYPSGGFNGGYGPRAF